MGLMDYEVLATLLPEPVLEKFFYWAWPPFFEMVDVGSAGKHRVEHATIFALSPRRKTPRIDDVLEKHHRRVAASCARSC